MKKTKRSKVWAVTKKNSIGIHLIADFWGVKEIKNPKELERLLVLAAKHAENTPLKFSFHKFNPYGITGVLLLAESHIAWHSWPEYGYLAIDIFTCGSKTIPDRALEFFIKKLKPRKIKVKKIYRGKNGN